MKGKLSKLVIALFVILGICIMGITTVIAAPNKQKAKSVNSYVKLTNGIQTKSFWKIISRDSAYTNFCLKGGASLPSYYVTLNGTQSIYDITNPTAYFKSVEAYHSTLWLVDNAYINTVDDTTKSVLKENLKAQLTDETAKQALDELSDNEILAVEACIFWNYSINVESFKDNATVKISDTTKQNYANALYTNLKAVADSHSDYEHVETDFSITTASNFNVSISSRMAGPFITTATLTEDNIILEVNGTTYTSGFTVNKHATLENGYTITLPENSINTGEGAINNVGIKYKGIRTTANFLTESGLQNLLSMTKTLVNTSASASETEPVAEMDLALVKTIVSYTDPNTGDVTQVSRFNPNTDISTEELDNGSSTDASYIVEKGVIKVQKGSTVTYRLYVFNEGKVNANAQIIDYIPKGLEIVNTSEWSVDYTNPITINGNEFYKATYKGMFKNLISAYDGTTLSYDYVEMECTVQDTVTSGEILRNYAEINAHAASSQVQRDIDSTSNTVGNDSNLENYITTVESFEDYTLFKAEYNQQDDDDFEQITIAEKNIDLALRKYISKVNDVSTNRQPLIYGSEEPDLTTAMSFLSSGESTYHYDHSKEVIELYKGDYITYTIRVYNETLPENYNGYAFKIIDKLPEGLEFDEEKTNEANAITEANIDTEGVHLAWLDTIVYDEQTHTLQIYGKEDSSYNLETMMNAYITSSLLDEEPYHYQEVNIVCKVSDNAPTETNLINVAQISAYYIDGVGIVDDSNENTNKLNGIVTDADSTVTSTYTDNDGTLANTSDAIYNHATTKLADYSPDSESYVAGLQDDDDFDTVII